MFLRKRRSICVEEVDVTTALNVVYQQVPVWRYGLASVGNCGWKNRSVWFVHFDASSREWTTVVNELRKRNLKQLLTDKRKGMFKIEYEDLNVKES